jgi:putative endonuclease
MGKVWLGRLGERLVAERLQMRGYRIVDANVRLGPLELDLVARTGRTLVFCEVRTRSVGSFVDPLFTFTWDKQAHVRQAAARYLSTRKPAYDEVRFDAAAVLVDATRRIARIRYVESAFE